MLQYDFLVIGSGIGGLGFALKVAAYGKVAVLCKGPADATNTRFAQGGLSAVLNSADSPDRHIEDTLMAGAGLCDEKMVWLLAENAPACIQELSALGVAFTCTAEGNLDLGREGGHSRNRIVHTHDHTGFSIQQALLQQVKKQPNITLLENYFAVDLIEGKTSDGTPACLGALVLNSEHNVSFPIFAKATMLASGGLGQVFAHTTNPAVATGDGIAMAKRAGAKIKDLEFIQFHPTALYDPGKPVFLISEAVRGFGAELKRPDGTPFMAEYHGQGSLAPRDIVARAIHREMQLANSEFIYLDLRHLPEAEIKERFPKIYARCLQSNLDLTTDLIPVVPAAHYSCGGVVTDLNGKTSVENLYACGEVACTGIHGANRLASNSLPEAWIFARRAAEKVVSEMVFRSYMLMPVQELKLVGNSVPATILAEKKEKVQQLMWQYAGIIRTPMGLLNCRQQLEELELETENLIRTFAASFELLELRNLVQVAGLILDAALKRKESVGCHFINAQAEIAKQLTVAKVEV